MTFSFSAEVSRDALRNAARAIGLAVLLVAALAAPAEAGVWDISGQVVYADDQAAPGAEVRLVTPSGAVFTTVADGSGYYQLYADDPNSSGLADLQAFKDGDASPVYEVMDRDITAALTLSGP